jgi:hypothetical protein
VLIAVKLEYNSETVHDLDSNCEVAWVKFDLKGNGTVNIGSYYRRHAPHLRRLSGLYGEVYNHQGRFQDL